jgi:SAM-dependent methyltransferase
MSPIRQLDFANYAPPYFAGTPRVLEIGPDSRPSTHQQQLADPPERWDPLDIFADPRETYSGTDPYMFPTPYDTNDVILARNVREHLPRVWVWIKEAARVCKPGGFVFTVNPLSWPYHEAAVDCWHEPMRRIGSSPACRS